MSELLWSRPDHGGVEQVQLAALRALHDVTKRVHASLDLPATLDAVAAAVVATAGFGVAAVNLRRQGVFEVVSVAGDEAARRQLLGSWNSVERWSRLIAHAERLGGLYLLDHRSTDVIRNDPGWWVPDLPVPPDENAWQPLDALFAQLTSPSGEWLGVLSVDLPAGGRRPGPVQLEVLELLADQATIAITHAVLHDALQHQESAARHSARHDPLTGLANRIMLTEQGQRRAQATQAAAGSQPEAGGARADGGAGDGAAAASEAAVLLIDLDGFKRINDLHGHEAGDDLLRVVADRLRRCARTDDLVARIGGDEFVVLLHGPDTGKAARLLAARIRRALSRRERGHDNGPLIGASIGIAVRPVPATLQELLAHADRAMYADKRRRRKRAADRPPPG